MPPPADPVVPCVLVVDDADATRNGLIDLLRLRGYAAYGARNGAEGLQVLRRLPSPCVVVLDLAMPDTDGYWFREHQLKDPAIAHVPVLVFTGAGEPKDLPGCQVLKKPFSLDELLAAIVRCCEGMSGRQSGG